MMIGQERCCGICSCFLSRYWKVFQVIFIVVKEMHLPKEKFLKKTYAALASN